MIRAVQLLLLAAILLCAGWAATEQHYQSCVLKRIAAGAAITTGDLPSGDGFDLDQTPERSWKINRISLRGCTRWPV